MYWPAEWRAVIKDVFVEMKKNTRLAIFFLALFYVAFPRAENISSQISPDVSPELEYMEEPEMEYLQEPEGNAGSAVNKRLSDLNQRANLTEPDNLNSADLVKIIDASITICNIALAQRYIQRLKESEEAESAVVVAQMEEQLKNKFVAMQLHKKNLHKLAVVTQAGDITAIKAAIRAAMKTISCPDDRHQLVAVVKNIQAMLKSEAREKQRVMNRAISKGQAAQNEEIQRRKMIAQSILLLIGVFDLDSGTSGMANIQGFQQTENLTDVGIKGLTQLIESQYGRDDSSGAGCAIDSNVTDDKNNVYYVSTSTLSATGNPVVRYRINAQPKASSLPADMLLGPYDSLATARMIVDNICPAYRRAGN